MDAPKRYEYILTQKGLDLYPIIMSVVHWGNIHMVDSRGRPMLHEHKTCGKHFDPLMICSECGEPVLAKEVHVHPGPGARETAMPRTQIAKTQVKVQAPKAAASRAKRA
jgi:hypothetical protein